STTLELQGTADTSTYWIGAKGMVPLERLLTLGNATGFPSEIKDTTASAVVDLNISGTWAGFAPAKMRGTAHLQNLAAWIPGIKDRLILTEADAQISEIELVLANVNGQFEHTPVSFTGTLNNSWSCQGGPPCPIEFDLHSEKLSISDLAGLLGSADKGWKFPFFSGSASKLPDFRANGTLTANQLTAAQLPLEKFTAHVEFSDKALLVSRINARLGGGSMDGEWRADWSSPSPHFTANGEFTGVATDRITSDGPDFALVSAWVNGHADAKYSLHFDGKSLDDMINSASGHVEYLVTNGASKALTLDGAKPLRFQSLQGAMDLEKRTLKILPSKFRAESRIYDLSGTVSLADKQARLKLSSNSSRWEITGALDKPQIAGPPASSETTAARTR
ncbi:MAG TPA: AsmA-like C-terminal region-containing protein, partial [Candidatus Angelobacter sp.]|nr:AsmA-like C-terminal region-containing protein [Candidatus Angelobacter sp.]